MKTIVLTDALKPATIRFLYGPTRVVHIALDR
jgi:hypothetical protein